MPPAAAVAAVFSPDLGAPSHVPIPLSMLLPLLPLCCCAHPCRYGSANLWKLMVAQEVAERLKVGPCRRPIDAAAAANAGAVALPPLLLKPGTLLLLLLPLLLLPLHPRAACAHACPPQVCPLLPQGTGVSVFAVHPGMSKTEFFPKMVWALGRCMLLLPTRLASTCMRCGSLLLPLVPRFLMQPSLLRQRRLLPLPRPRTTHKPNRPCTTRCSRRGGRVPPPAPPPPCLQPRSPGWRVRAGG